MKIPLMCIRLRWLPLPCQTNQSRQNEQAPGHEDDVLHESRRLRALAV
jgi:hypothetical protein